MSIVGVEEKDKYSESCRGETSGTFFMYERKEYCDLQKVPLNDKWDFFTETCSFL